MKKRTDFVTAARKTLEILKTGESYTLNKLSEETHLNFRTVKKILEVLESNAKLVSGKTLDISVFDNLTVVRMKDKTGLSVYPQNIQNLIIKTMHYPTPSREEEILVHLLLEDALATSSAISISEDIMLQDLFKAKYVAKTKDGRYYLTSDGKYIAKGALELYPELQKMSKTSGEIVEKQIISSFEQPSIPVAPSLLMIRQKLQVIKNR
jgi:predicted transcriptional regulator